MRSLTFAVSTLSLLTVAFLTAAPAHGQQEPEKIKFDTVDQVTLRGEFYPSAKDGKKSPVVMMLHKIGGSSTQDGYKDMAMELQKAGFAVLLFDFRGHGDSTEVNQGFWMDATNVKMFRGKGFNPQKPPESISYKDFDTSYYPQFVNDIAAAKAYLDKRNDAGDCNSANVILIGAEDGATLGVSWMYAEMHRYRWISQFPSVRENKCEGYQITAGIWLSISSKIGSHTPPLKSWIKYLGQERDVPMAFVYGAKSRGDDSVAKTLLDTAKGKGNDKWTGMMGIKDTDLKGHGLLSNKLNGRSWINETYLTKLVKEKSLEVWERRDEKFKSSAYLWEFPKGSVPGKIPDESVLRRTPVELLYSP